ncbi:MAG: hypothetical protein KC486_02455, partial [Myxococcales bacterium]|nr:hypothetical protein [Myxococcales bacterium]
MEREQVLLSLLWIPALPLLAAALGRLLAPLLRREPARYGARALQLAAGSTALTALLLASALRQLLRGDAPRIVEALWSWITIGTTTTLRAELVLDPLSGAVIVGLLLLTFLAQLVAQGRPRQLLVTSAALGGGLLLALGKSLGIIALGWHILGIAALFAGEGPTRRRIRLLALADAALWLSFGAATYAAGAPDVGQILRTTLQGPESRFGALELAGIPLAGVAGAALVVAVVARALGAARPRGEPQRDRGPLEALLAGPLTLLPAAYLLLRLSPVVAMDAALLTVVAAGGALL